MKQSISRVSVFLAGRVRVLHRNDVNCTGWLLVCGVRPRVIKTSDPKRECLAIASALAGEGEAVGMDGSARRVGRGVSGLRVTSAPHAAKLAREASCSPRSTATKAKAATWDSGCKRATNCNADSRDDSRHC